MNTWKESSVDKPKIGNRCIGWSATGKCWLQVYYRPDLTLSKEDCCWWQTVSGKLYNDNDISFWMIPEEPLVAPKNGQLYHFEKGGYYTVLDNVNHEANGSPMVTYQSLFDQRKYVRDLEPFLKKFTIVDYVIEFICDKCVPRGCSHKNKDLVTRYCVICRDTTVHWVRPDLYTTCKNAIGKKIIYRGTNGNEYDKENHGKLLSGMGILEEMVTGHGICTKIREEPSGVIYWVDPIHIEVLND